MAYFLEVLFGMFPRRQYLALRLVAYIFLGPIVETLRSFIMMILFRLEMKSLNLPQMGINFKRVVEARSTPTTVDFVSA